MGIWQLLCATDIKRVARSPERVREVADTYFHAKVSLRDDLTLAERRARLHDKYQELLARVPAHTHPQVLAAQLAALRQLDVLERGGSTRSTSPCPSPTLPAPPSPRGRVASPQSPRYADVVAGSVGAATAPPPAPPGAQAPLATPRARPLAPSAGSAQQMSPPPPPPQSASAPRPQPPQPPQAHGSPGVQPSPRLSYAEVARRRT